MAETTNNIIGKVFTGSTSYYCHAAQVIRTTKKFAYVRPVPMLSTYDKWGGGDHEVDWAWVEEHPISGKQTGGEAYTLVESEEGICLRKGRGTTQKFLAEAQRGVKIHTCSP